jgi:hypothetical protein
VGATPPAVRTALPALQQQVRLMGIRFSAYEKQLASLREQVATVDDLKATDRRTARAPRSELL